MANSSRMRALMATAVGVCVVSLVAVAAPRPSDSGGSGICVGVNRMVECVSPGSGGG